MKAHRSLPAEQSARATYQDVLDAPPNKVAELIDGTLYTQPRPASPYARASSRMGMEIGPPFDMGRGGPGGWWIFDEPELHFGDEDDPDVLVPDVAGWRRATMPKPPVAPYFTQAPDWVCEVLSPSTRRVDLGEKRAVYAREGVGRQWFVDPDARTLEAFELRGGEWAPVGAARDKGPVSLPPFDAISFPLESLWLE